MSIKIYGNTRFGPTATSAASLITTNMLLYLDASNPTSYPGSGTTWTDLSTNTNDVTLVNGPTYSSANGGKIIFDGVDDWGNSALAKQGSSTGNYTFGAWVKPNDITGAANHFLGRGGYENSFYNGWSFLLTFSSGKPGASVVTMSPSIVGAGTPAGTRTVSTDGWYYVVGVWTAGTSLKLYLNGTLEATLNTSGTNLRQSNFYGWTLATVIQTQYASTELGAVHVYNTVLTDSEILQNFNATKARFPLGTIT